MRPAARPHARTVTAAVVALLGLAATGAPVPAAPGGAPTDAALASLPTVASGVRPGPDVLYAPPPAAPVLENRHPRFRAAPLLVSGTEAYVDGEYLYQDHLYDDYGADTDGGGASSFSARAGDITYPDDPRYGGNAADLVEFRVAVGADDVLYRVTLNTLLEPDTTIVAIALDTDRDVTTGTATLAGDPGAPFPGTDETIVLWGTGGAHHRSGAGGTVATPLDVTVDTEANQLTVAVPRHVSDPRGTVRTTVAVGLHDGDGGWRRPARQATAEQPGGAGALAPAPSGILNLAFRFDEPYVGRNVPPDVDQAQALRDGAPTRFAHDIDFAALDAGEHRTTVPATGTQIRLYPSRLDLGEGRDLAGGHPQYRGQLQPYSLYVPTGYDPATPVGFTLNLHSLGQEHWQYNGSIGVRQLGEERTAIVASPHGRGPDGWYQHSAEVDVFEVWNDVARHFRLDPDRAASAGYSMGGYGTYRLAMLYPDLFGAALTVVGPPGDGIWLPPAPPTGGAATNTNRWLDNARNVPFLNVVAAADELVPVVGPRAQNLGAPELGIDGFEQLGYRFRFLLFPAAEHFTIAALGYDLPMAVDFLGEAAVDRDPPHVTFTYLPATDDRDLGLVHDHAYWVSQVVPADPSADLAAATVDARSHGHGVGPAPTASHVGTGQVPLPYTVVGRTWGEPPATAPANRMDLTLTGVGSLHLDLARARLDPATMLTLEITADVAGELRLDGRFPGGTVVTRDGTPVDGATAGPDGAVVPVVTGTQTVVLRPGAAPGRPAPPVLPATGGGLAPLAAVLATVAVLARRRH